jgi:Pectate lyase superfamily protein
MIELRPGKFAALALFGLAIGLSVPSATHSQAVTPNWINVKSFGAVGDGVTDDTPAVEQAIQAAVNRGGQGGNVVYFPPAKQYYLASPLVLPDANGWTTLFLDGPVRLDHTLEMKSFYVIRGNSGGSRQAFSTVPLGQILTPYNGEPTIHINATDVRIQNIQMQYVRDGSDGIVIEQSANVDLDNVFVDMDSNNVTGHALVIRGGFGYRVIGGSYNAPGTSSILIGSDARCNSTGIMSFKNVFLGDHGISLEPQCAPLTMLTFEGILYESAQDALLTIQPTGDGQIDGVRVLDSTMADELSPKPPLIQNKGSRAFSVIVQNCPIDAQQLTAGDPIADLEVWTAQDNTVIGQSSGYVLHRPSGVVSTMPGSGTSPSAVLMPQSTHRLNISMPRFDQ